MTNAATAPVLVSSTGMPHYAVTNPSTGAVTGTKCNPHKLPRRFELVVDGSRTVCCHRCERVDPFR